MKSSQVFREKIGEFGDKVKEVERHSNRFDFNVLRFYLSE